MLQNLSPGISDREWAQSKRAHLYFQYFFFILLAVFLCFQKVLYLQIESKNMTYLNQDIKSVTQTRKRGEIKTPIIKSTQQSCHVSYVCLEFHHRLNCGLHEVKNGPHGPIYEPIFVLGERIMPMSRYQSPYTNATGINF